LPAGRTIWPLIANNLAQNLYRFYQSRNKVVLYVGAGGGQLLDTSADFSKLIAVDQNQDSLNHHNFDLRRG
jgi:hypothetical protein